MIGYVTLGTNSLPRAAAFYDALLGEVGAKRMMGCFTSKSAAVGRGRRGRAGTTG